MNFVLSFETSGDANRYVLAFWKKVKELLNKKCEKKSYGEEFVSIGVIPTIMEDRFLSSEWKERRLIRYAKKDADIRLIMDYNKFVNADEKMRFLLYVKVIVDSIKVVDSKKCGDFQGNELISDVLDALKVKWEDVKDLEELDPRYPLSRSAKENNDLAKQREMNQQ